jgi:hypothetical protein
VKRFLPLVLAAALATEGSAYIDALYPLQQFIEESEVIAEGVVEKTDPRKGVSFIRVKKSIKGKCQYDLLRLNLGAGQEWHPEAVLPHMVVGAPAVIFYNAERRGEIYLNRFFLQLTGDAGQPADKAWWTFTHVEIHCTRTFNGTTEELSRILADVQAGTAKAPAADPKAPAITKDALKALPVWGQPVDPGKLPLPFVRRDPARPRKSRTPENPPAAEKGLAFQYFEGTWDALPDFAALKPAATGVSEQFDLSKRKRDEQYALRFTGYIDIPREGTYRFHTLSDDGTRLRIGNEEVVTNDGRHASKEESGEIALKAGRHAITLLYFQNDGPALLDVHWEGPDLPKQKVPAAALTHTPTP